MEPQTNTEQSLFCPKCKTKVSPMDIFCPACGKKLKEKAASTSFWTQLGIYLFSIFLAPLGIIFAIKYLKQDDKKAKNIGIFTLILTILVTVIGLIYAVQLGYMISKLYSGSYNINAGTGGYLGF